MIHNHLAADPLPRMKCALVLCLLFLFPFEGTPYVYETCLSMLQLFQQYCSREGYSIGCPSTKKFHYFRNHAAGSQFSDIRNCMIQVCDMLLARWNEIAARFEKGETPEGACSKNTKTCDD
ncbi:hypothetical protein L596_016845 [Steinernema carpocapsae]|uniref:Uncharacterized protein n=1 Tax=Steinernema carpocapsae TaxID=34508 RepID=A0A4U5NKH2_STECR|nr:hypothetical protein L596_016845 [Steinernema carpocapsae]